MKPYLLNNINTICTLFKKLYYVNNGGCCYLAYIIADYLEKRQINYSVLLYDSKTYYNLPTEAVQHVAIKVGNTILNFDKVCSHDKVSDLTNIKAKDLLAYYKKCTCWNSLYNNANNRFLKSTFTKLLAHVE